jgi:hypothetical protein
MTTAAIRSHFVPMLPCGVSRMQGLGLETFERA